MRLKRHESVSNMLMLLKKPLHTASQICAAEICSNDKETHYITYRGFCFRFFFLCSSSSLSFFSTAITSELYFR